MNDALSLSGGDLAPVMTAEQRATAAWARWYARHTPEEDPSEGADTPTISEPPFLVNCDDLLSRLFSI